MPDTANPARPPAARRRLRVDGGVIEYTVQRSSRRKKTVQISVTNGEVLVAAPLRAPYREIEAIVRDKGGWILGRLKASAAEPPPPRLVTGETLPYLGRQLPLVVADGDARKPSAALDAAGRLLVWAPRGLAGEERREAVRAALVAWYRAQAAQILADAVARWLPVMGIREMPPVLVREQRTRWGSCSANGTLRFSWRLAMLEPELIESVAVHELAHLEVMNHSPDFWAVVLRAMPDALARRKRLSIAGRRLPL